MRKTCQFLALILAATFLISCGDDEKPGQSFHALLDGEEYKEDGIIGYEEDLDVEVEATRGNDDYFYVWVDLEEVDSPGTYQIDENTTGVGVDFEVDGGDYYLIDGEMTITKVSKSRLEATFSGVAEDWESGETIVVTEGVVKANVKSYE
jgi:hypothetical protein